VEYTPYVDLILKPMVSVILPTFNRSRFLPAAFHDEPVARFVFRAGLESFRELAPRAHRVMASATALRFTLAAAHRVVDRIHHHAADMRSAPLPARPTGLAARDVHVIDVANLTDRRETGLVNRTVPDITLTTSHQVFLLARG